MCTVLNVGPLRRGDAVRRSDTTLIWPRPPRPTCVCDALQAHRVRVARRVWVARRAWVAWVPPQDLGARRTARHGGLLPVRRAAGIDRLGFYPLNSEGPGNALDYHLCGAGFPAGSTPRSQTFKLGNI